MPRLMEKADWVRTVANVGAADHVWCENVVGRDGALSFSIPENGLYQVIIVQLDNAQEMPQSPVAANLEPGKGSPSNDALLAKWDDLVRAGEGRLKQPYHFRRADAYDEELA